VAKHKNKSEKAWNRKEVDNESRLIFKDYIDIYCID
jgi:hypothetical protein